MRSFVHSWFQVRDYAPLDTWAVATVGDVGVFTPQHGPAQEVPYDATLSIYLPEQIRANKDGHTIVLEGGGSEADVTVFTSFFEGGIRINLDSAGAHSGGTVAKGTEYSVTVRSSYSSGILLDTQTWSRRPPRCVDSVQYGSRFVCYRLKQARPP